MPSQVCSSTPNAKPFEQVMDYITQLLIEGLHEGHYEFTVQVQPHTNDKRRVTVKAGPSCQFTLRNDEIPR